MKNNYLCPFLLEHRIINFQLFIKNKILIRKNQKIIKNIKKLVNNNDPITLENIINKNRFVYNVDKLFPIIVKKKMYLYIIDSLNEYLKSNNREIYTNSLICRKDRIEINKLYKKLYKEKEKSEIPIELKIISTLKKFDIIGTFFPIKDYEMIEKSKFLSIYNELRNMWLTFRNDNDLDEEVLFGEEIIWDYVKKGNYEIMVLDKINILLNKNLDKNIKIMISYIILGAFSYVCPHLKKKYENIIFN